MTDVGELRPVDDESSDAPSDEDFAPSGASVVSSEDDSSADEAAQAPKTASAAPRKRKRLTQPAQDQEQGLDSGDEATIRRGQERKERKRAKQESTSAGKGQKKKGKSKGKGGKKAAATADEEASDDLGLSDEEEEGEGGLIKTRSQRKAEKQTRQRRPLYPIGQATADIDSIWSRLSGLGVGRRKSIDPSPDTDEKDPSSNAFGPKGSAATDDEMITITRTYTFAGEDKTETKRVSKHSAEGKLWLASHPEGQDSQDQQPENLPADPEKPLNRPLRRPSRFDGNSTGEVKALPPHLQSYWRNPLTIAKIADAKRRGSGVAFTAPSATAGGSRGTKAKGKTKETRPGALNTVEKSRLDWVGYVDKAGIQNELEVYGKGKEGYLDRMNFLDRMADKRDEAGRSIA